jgi:hypothetical protein
MYGHAFKQHNSSSRLLVFSSPHLIRFYDTQTLHYTHTTCNARTPMSLQDIATDTTYEFWVGPTWASDLLACVRAHSNYCTRRFGTWLITTVRWMVSIYHFTIYTTHIYYCLDFTAFRVNKPHRYFEHPSSSEKKSVSENDSVFRWKW